MTVSLIMEDFLGVDPLTKYKLNHDATFFHTGESLKV